MTDTPVYGRRRTLPAAPAQSPEPPFGGRETAVEGRVVSTPSQTPTASGWDEAERVAQASGGDVYLKITENKTVIKILAEGPFDAYNSHWIEEIEEGSKSVRCWGANTDCPLCAIGDKAKRYSACFSVVTLEDPEHPSLRVWEAGVKILRQLKEIAFDPKRGPLNRTDIYFTIRKVQKAKAVEYTLERVKERDLEEEYGVVPMTQETLRRFTDQMHTEPIKTLYNFEAMQEVADLLMRG